MPRGGNSSRRKGMAGELEVVKLLQRVWGGEFRRSGSGFDGKDIICPEGFPFTIEVKNRRDIRIKHLWFPNSAFKQCLKQACGQAAAEDKPFLLFVKAEGTWFAVVEKGTIEDHNLHGVLHQGTYDVYVAKTFLEEHPLSLEEDLPG